MREKQLQEFLDRARQLEEVGKYEEAAALLKPFWKGLGARPETSFYSPEAGAELLLSAGSLTGWLGDIRKQKGSQSLARELLLESLEILIDLNLVERVADARINLAISCWREGAYAQAHQHLDEALLSVGDRKCNARARVHLNRAVIFNTTGQLPDSLQLLTEHEGLFAESDSDSLKGRYHNTLGNVLSYLGTAEDREDYRDRAYVEYAAASYHLERAGNIRLFVIVQNQLAYLSYRSGDYAQTHEHLDRVQDLLLSLFDENLSACLSDTRANVLIAQKEYARAEAILTPIIERLKSSGDRVRASELLVTYGRLLARTKRRAAAYRILSEATATAMAAGDQEMAGQAQLTVLEELSGQLSSTAAEEIYHRADLLLLKSQHPETLFRLRAAASHLIQARALVSHSVRAHQLPYVSCLKDEVGLFEIAARQAQATAPLFITVEDETGEELLLLARLIHQLSKRPGQFREFACGTSSSSATSEFSAALKAAARGTLFLNQVEELTLPDQEMLRERLAQQLENRAHPDQASPQDVRLIITTAANLDHEVSTGLFSPALRGWLLNCRLHLAPLVERPEDAVHLVNYLIGEARKRAQKEVWFERASILQLQKLALRLELRELRALIEQTVNRAGPGAIIATRAIEIAAVRQSLPLHLLDPWAGCSLQKERARFENRLIELALEETAGHFSQAAKLLGAPRQKLSLAAKSGQLRASNGERSGSRETPVSLRSRQRHPRSSPAELEKGGAEER